MEKTNCDLCGLPFGKPYLRYDYLSFPCCVSMCTNCGLVKLNPRWSESKYDWFYKYKYDLFYRSPGKSAEELFTIDASSKGKKMSERLRDLPFPARLKMLDVGAGTGFSFFTLPLNVQVEAYAIESSLKCIPFLQRKGISIIGTNFSGDFGYEYDLVVVRHVLEHVLDPVHFMKKIHQCLQEDGLVYLAVPNAMHFNDKKANSFFRHVHTYYYNLRTLLQICAMAGFSHLKDGQETELWAILRKNNKGDRSGDALPDISPEAQLVILKRYVRCSRQPIKRRFITIARRLAYSTSECKKTGT